MARILCLVVILLEIRGLSLSLGYRKWAALMFYTQLSNLVTAISAFFLLIFGELSWIIILRYISTCMLVMTAFVTICVLIPMGGSPKKLLWSGNGLYHHVLCPIVSSFSYIVFEQHSHFIVLPVVITLIYGLIMLRLNAIHKADGPYPFFRVYQQTLAKTVLWVFVLMACMAVISICVHIIAGS